MIRRIDGVLAGLGVARCFHFSLMVESFATWAAAKFRCPRSHSFGFKKCVNMDLVKI